LDQQAGVTVTQLVEKRGFFFNVAKSRSVKFTFVAFFFTKKYEIVPGASLPRFAVGLDYR
jgi:hypothetical protein